MKSSTPTTPAAAPPIFSEGGPEASSTGASRWPLGRIVFYTSVSSTNTIALEAREDGLVVVAEEQTAGRGRRGHAWSSARGLGLWCSVCLEGAPAGLTFAAAAAIHAVLKDHAPVALKWPNDILCGGRKLGGILVEHRAGWNALGFGINVHHREDDFPEPLRETATSLSRCTSVEWSRDNLLASVLMELAPRVRALREGRLEAVRGEWVSLLALEGRRLRRDGVEGVVEGIGEDGALLLKTAAGHEVIAAGEVEWLEE